jgi:thiol-disulfide isomerase/thioredoxin
VAVNWYTDSLLYEQSQTFPADLLEGACLMKNAIIVSVFLLIAVTIAGCSRSTTLAIGSPAPGFKLEDLRGNVVTLEQYRGKIVLLDFWATWCGPCRMTMPVIERVQQQYSNDLAVLAINLQEEPDQVRRYVEQQKIHSTVLLDRDGEVGRIYQSESIPMQVLIDQEGIVRKIQVGFSPRMGDDLRAQIEGLRAE